MLHGRTLAQRAVSPRGSKWPLFEKSGAKTFLNWGRGSETSTAQRSKVFLLLFVHKK
jgi:hypothetical protein